MNDDDERLFRCYECGYETLGTLKEVVTCTHCGKLLHKGGEN